MIWRNTIGMTAALALAAVAAVRAGASDAIESGQREIGNTMVDAASPRPDLEGRTLDRHLKIQHIGLEPAPLAKESPSAILKFHVSNQGTIRLTDVYLQISIVEKMDPDQTPMTRRVLAGPFMIRGTVVLEAGFTIDSEILLRNLSPDCSCVPNVEVVSVRALPDSGS